MNTNNNKVQNWVIICYGNILRSQVLEQYLRHYSTLWNIDINFYSAGVANKDEFTNEQSLLKEISQQLLKRQIKYSLHRDAWNKKVEEKILTADIILFADNKVKTIALERINKKINKEKVFTFYELISEGEKDFQDTYDYEKKKQDPIRFKNAFDELDRIATKILSKYRNSF